MPNLISESVVTARKPHRCLCCGVVAIQPGQRYHREVYVYDGSACTWISCADCDAIAGDVYDWYGAPDEGVSADECDEWAHEHRSEDARAAAYLARRWGEGLPEKVQRFTSAKRGAQAVASTLTPERPADRRNA